MEQKPKSSWRLIVILAEAAVIAALAVFGALWISKLQKKIEKIENIPPAVSFDASGKVFFSDSGFGNVWLPALDNTPRNEYQYENLTEENGLRYYSENGTVLSEVGIDVSTFQGDIDWDKVKKAGIDFAMLRLGFRGYGESGKLLVDDRFEEYLSGAEKAGLKIGVYFFSQAITVEEAREEAQLVLDTLAGHEIDYPIAYDFEVVFYDESRTADIAVSTMTDCCIAFCDKIQKAGYTPMVYANERTALFKYDLSVLSGYELWLADYVTTPDFPYAFSMWQYSDTGTVDGIEGEVDLNLSFKKQE